jgi:hypothetical protein
MKLTEETRIEDILHNKRWLLGYFLYAILNGAVRKWVFVSSSLVNNLFLTIQFLLPIAIVFFMRREKSIFSYHPLIPYIFVLLGMAFNPMNQSIFHGFFGILLHLGFWFVMLAYLHERAVFPFEQLVKPFIIVSIGEIILSIIQFTLPDTHFINRYESGTEVSGFVTGAVRVVGSFSYIGGYAAFIFFVGLLVWALMVEKKQSIQVISIVALLGLLGGFMNGSRAIVLPFILFVIFGFLGYGTLSSKLRAVAIIVIGISLGLVFKLDKKFPTIEMAYGAFMGRVESGQSSGESEGRTAEIFKGVTKFRGNYPLFGVGLGATYQGAVTTWGQSAAVKEYGYYEQEPERIILEGGFVLLIIRALLFVYFMFKSKIPIVFSAPILFFIFFFTQMTFSGYQSTFTFFGLALLDKMYYLKSLEPNENALS